MEQPQPCEREGGKRQADDVDPAMNDECKKHKKASCFLDVDEFKQLNQEMMEYDEKREKVIKLSRDVNKLSKQAIYALHEESIEKASECIQQAEGVINKIRQVVQSDSSLRSGSFSNALEEYVEACCFRKYLADGDLLPMSVLSDIDRYEYLGGVLDFTGEIARYAVKQATARNVHSVQKCRDIVAAIDGAMIQFDASFGRLGKKIPTLQSSLKKIEVSGH